MDYTTEMNGPNASNDLISSGYTYESDNLSIDFKRRPIGRDYHSHSYLKARNFCFREKVIRYKLILVQMNKLNSVHYTLQNDAPGTIQDMVRVYYRFKDLKKEARKLKPIPKFLVSMNYF